MNVQTAILIAAALATLGWLHTGRRARILAKKQHTINIMLKAAFDQDFREALANMKPYLKAKNCPDFNDQEHKHVEGDFRLVLNHYEFVAAGVRNGDIDEKLVKDSEEGTFAAIVETCHDHIYRLRDSRTRQTIYEHLEWLYGRWRKRPPGFFQRCTERMLNRPIAGRRVKAID